MISMYRGAWGLLGVVSAAWLLANCGGTPAEDGPDENAGGTGPGGADSGGSPSAGAPSGGAPSTGGSASNAADSSEPLAGPWGKVTFYYSANAVETTLIFRTQETDEYTDCETLERADGCTLRNCPISTNSDNFGGPTTATVVRGEEILGTVTVDSQGFQAFPALLAGDVATITAEGAEYPGYTGSVVFPGTFTLVEPAVVQGFVAVDSTQDLELSWEGGGDSTISFQTYAPDDVDAARERNVVCYFEPGSTSGVVPASMLAEVAGPNFGALYALHAVNVRAGEMTVQVRTATSVFAPAGFGVDFYVQ